MTCAVQLSAHEVTPTIADVTVTDGEMAVVLQLNVEAFIAGIDLDGLEDTDASEQSDTYDALRALEEAALAADIERFAQSRLPRLALSVDGAAVPLSLDAFTVPPVGNPDLPRRTELLLLAAVGEDARSFTLSWPRGSGDLVLRQQGVPEPFTGYVAAGQTSPSISIQGGTEQSGWSVFAEYIPVGFDHILPKGLDHILFVLGLFFLSTKLRPLIWQVSAFTLAHTVTLALGALGLVSIPGSIVEPLIAASIVFVAVENLFTDGLNRWRPLVIFGFGLLHGLGFASVLEEFGLPSGQFIPALIGFNVGVELGQLTVIALAFFAVGYWFGQKPWYRQAIAIPASCAIAAIGAYWFVERVFL